MYCTFMHVGEEQLVAERIECNGVSWRRSLIPICFDSAALNDAQSVWPFSSRWHKWACSTAALLQKPTSLNYKKRENASWKHWGTAMHLAIQEENYFNDLTTSSSRVLSLQRGCAERNQGHVQLKRKEKGQRDR